MIVFILLAIIIHATFVFYIRIFEKPLLDNNYEGEKGKIKIRIGLSFLYIIGAHAILFIIFEPSYKDYRKYYAIWDKKVLIDILRSNIINFILYGYNICIIFKNKIRRKKFYKKFNFKDISALKTNFIAPFIEEVIFTVLLYPLFVSSEVKNPKAFYLSSALLFSVTHIHMKWEELLEIIQTYLDPNNKDYGIINLLKDFIITIIGVCTITFIFKLYIFYTMSRYENFWVCWMIHCFCNILGTPIIKNPQSKSILIHLFCIFCFFMAQNYL